MLKECLLSLLAISVAAILIIIFVTVAGNLLFPSALHIFETRIPEASGPVDSTPEVESAPASVADTTPFSEPEPTGDLEPITEPTVEPELTVDATSPQSVPSSQPLKPETRQGPQPPVETAQAETPASEPPATIDGMIDNLAPGAMLPLGDGGIAYKVQSGDTFSQICKKVIGTGRPAVWKEAARMMGINYRTIRPGEALIFDKSVLDLGREEE